MYCIDIVLYVLKITYKLSEAIQVKRKEGYMSRPAGKERGKEAPELVYQ